jgi:hypothetical protein
MEDDPLTAKTCSPVGEWVCHPEIRCLKIHRTEICGPGN